MSERKSTYQLTIYSVCKDAGYPADVHDEVYGYYSSVEMGESVIRNIVQRNKSCTFEFEDRRIICFSLQEFFIDTCNQQYSGLERTYDSMGCYCGSYDQGEPKLFTGRVPSECHFKEGALVEVINDKRICPGIVLFCPPAPEKAKETNERFKRRMDSLRTDNDIPISQNEDCDGCILIQTKKENTEYCGLDQSDDCYLVEFDTNDEDHAHVPENAAFKPAGTIPDELRERLIEQYMFHSGHGKYYVDCRNHKETGTFIIGLNRCMLDRISEPHVIIRSDYNHIILSLESFQVLTGSIEKLVNDGSLEMYQKTISYIKRNLAEIKFDFETLAVKRRE